MAIEGFLSINCWVDICVVLTTVILSIHLYAKYAYSYWKRKGIPSLEPRFPFGNIVDNILMRKSTGAVTTELYNQMEDKKYVGIYIFLRPVLLLKDLEVVKNVLVRDFADFVDRGIYYNEKDDPLSAHLFNLEGQRWKNLRSRLAPTFGGGKMKLMFPALESCVSLLEKHISENISNGKSLDLSDTLKRFSLTVIANVALGIELKNLDEDNEFTKMTFGVFQPSFAQYSRVTAAMLSRKLCYVLGLKVVPKTVSDYFLRTTEDIIKMRKNTNSKRNDFMQILIDLRDNVGNENTKTKNNDENNENLTFNELVAQVLIFLIAGYESNSTALTYCLYELALNKDIQDKLRKEIIEAGDINYETLNEMQYLDMVLSETLRKYPTVSFLQRICTKKYQLDDTIIDPETLVIVPVRAIHHDPRYYPDPDKFNPERFNKKSPAHPHVPYSYLPFGEGARYCIGMRFAKLQLKLTLFKLLSRFAFDVCDKTSIPIVEEPKTFILAPKNGLYLKVTEI